MRSILFALCAPLALLVSCNSVGGGASHEGGVVLAVHGGAGTITRSEMTPEQEAQYRGKIEEALRAGWRVLHDGGSSLDAVTTTIVVLEDSPLFNAGYGAVLTADERCELDASIMLGETGEAGAVAGVQSVKNPILAARAVMERSEHVMLSGSGADEFAQEQSLEQVPNEYFRTERRVRQLWERQEDDRKHGTVGCVALDQAGHLAAGTSTGGMTNKRWGRIGDSPVIGAGTWASDATCAVSATGWGEFFIRCAVAHEIHGRMLHGGESLHTASHAVIHETLTTAGGTGGVIALDRRGNVSAPFNTEGMYRGWIDVRGEVVIRIYGDE